MVVGSGEELLKAAGEAGTAGKKLFIANII